MMGNIAMLGFWFHSDIWITVGPIIVINVLLLVSLFSFLLTRQSKKRDIHEAARRSRSKYLSVYLKEWWVYTIDPLAKFFVKIKMGPNAISMVGFLLAVTAGFLFAKGLFGYAGWAMIFGATFDIFDGRVARLSGRESRSGAYFDSVLDRFSEGVCFLGLAYYFRSSWVLFFVVAGLIGSMMVSYTKARAESVGVECNVGAMQRPERIVYLGVASIFTPIANLMLLAWWSNPIPVLVIGATVIIAIATNATAIHRMIHAMNALDTDDEREKESIPQMITRLSTPEGREAFWDRKRYGYDRSKARYSHVVVFMVDGLQRRVLDDLVDKGEMPNLSQYLIGRGESSIATSTFPSTTGPDFTPMVTGCFPGTCDVPGAQWFDRTVPEGRILTMNRFRDYLGWGAYAMDYDLSRTVCTIFEYSRRAVNIFGMVNRGCGLIRDPAFFRLYSTFRRAGQKGDYDTMYRTANLWFSEALRREADYIFYAMPAVKALDDGANPMEALDVYRRIDKAIGKAMAQLKSRGIYDQTAIMFLGGHGRSVPKSKFDLNAFLDERYKVFTRPGKPREWLEAEAITTLSGSSMMHLYFRKNASWSEHSFFEEIETRGLVGALLERPEVDILAGRSAKGGIMVASRKGRAHVVEDPDGRLTYLVKGGDPFGYKDIPQVMKSTEALRLTAESDYPDGIMQVLQIFRSQRTGDLVVSADRLCNLMTGGSANDDVHGSLHADHVIVPFMSNVPLDMGIIRTADVFSLSLSFLGIEPSHHLDAMPLSEIKVGQNRQIKIG